MTTITKAYLVSKPTLKRTSAARGKRPHVSEIRLVAVANGIAHASVQINQKTIACFPLSAQGKHHARLGLVVVHHARLARVVGGFFFHLGVVKAHIGFEIPTHHWGFAAAKVDARAGGDETTILSRDVGGEKATQQTKRFVTRCHFQRNVFAKHRAALVAQSIATKHGAQRSGFERIEFGQVELWG